MNISRRPFHCRKCDKNFMEDTLENVIIKVWVAHVQSLRCPHCGANYHHTDMLSGDAYLKAWNELNPHSQITPEAWANIKAIEKQPWT